MDSLALNYDATAVLECNVLTHPEACNNNGYYYLGSPGDYEFYYDDGQNEVQLPTRTSLLMSLVFFLFLLVIP